VFSAGLSGINTSVMYSIIGLWSDIPADCGSAWTGQ
jgi:hypothetical protein